MTDPIEVRAFDKIHALATDETNAPAVLAELVMEWHAGPAALLLTSFVADLLEAIPGPALRDWLSKAPAGAKGFATVVEMLLKNEALAKVDAYLATLDVVQLSLVLGLSTRFLNRAAPLIAWDSMRAGLVADAGSDEESA